jgi:hypothetical protein
MVDGTYLTYSDMYLYGRNGSLLTSGMTEQ